MLNLVITSSDILYIRISFERVLRNIQKNLLLNTSEIINTINSRNNLLG
jgi:hypothetical protein